MDHSVHNRWIDINLDHIRHNVKEVQDLIGDARIMAVIKADAYGHGAIEVAKTVIDAGVHYLAVTTLDEALSLREAGIEAPVLVLSLLLEDQYAMAVTHNLTVTVNDISQVHKLADRAEAHADTLKVHMNIDVGMHRYGVNPEGALQLAKAIQERPCLKLEGVYTHFPQAEVRGVTLKQLQVFNQVVDELEGAGVHVALRHCANSTATVLYPSAVLDMVRVGTLLFGQCRVNGQLNLLPTWHLRAQIVALRDVPRGVAIGYGQAYRAKRPTKIAIIPLGFADGIGMWPVHRSTTIKALIKSLGKEILRFFGADVVTEKALVGGHSAPYIGKVGMQHMALDVTDIPEVALGDVVTLKVLQANCNKGLPKRYLGQVESHTRQLN